MKIKNLLPIPIIMTITCMLVSCMGGRPLVSTSSDNNVTYKVDYLFEHDGCKVYRFYDMGQPVYFTNCTGSVSVAKDDTTNTIIQNIIKQQSHK